MSLATFCVWLLLLGSGVVQLADSTFPYPVAASLFAVSLMVIIPTHACFYLPPSAPPSVFHLCSSFRFRLLHAHVPLVLLLQQPSQLQPALVPDLVSFSKAAVLLRCATRCLCSQNIDVCFFISLLLQVNTVLLDKTGTITEGLCCVRDVQSCKTSEGAATVADIMRHAASCAAATPDHPISR